MGSRHSTDLLDIALDRGYLNAEQVERVRNESRIRRCAPELMIVEWRMLSLRRLARLRLHVQYRTMRSADKDLIRLAVRWSWVEITNLDRRWTSNGSVRETSRTTTRTIERGAVRTD